MPLPVMATYFDPIREEVIVENLSEQGQTRYSVGSFNSLESAESYCQRVRAHGYANAHVIALWGIESIEVPLSEVKRFLDTH